VGRETKGAPWSCQRLHFRGRSRAVKILLPDLLLRWARRGQSERRFGVYTDPCLYRSSRRHSQVINGHTLHKGLVGMRGGTVAAESEDQGMGTLLTAPLPALESIHEQLNPAPPGDGRRAGAPRRQILVVNDNRDPVRLMARLLKITGKRTRAAHDGPGAVAVAEGCRR
jgi:hypothetical protein